jgi:WD40 repeat protein
MGNEFVFSGRGGYAYMQAWPWSAGFGTKFSSPATLPAGVAQGTHMSAVADAVAVANSGSPSVTVYPFSISGFGTKFSNPATLPGSASDVKFSVAGNFIAVSDYSSPYVAIYPWSGSGFGTKISNPGTLPGTYAYEVAFSADGAHVAVASEGSPYISAYPFTGAFGTKYSNPGTLPPAYGYAVTFSPSGNDIAVGTYTSTSITIYPWSAGFGTKYTDPVGFTGWQCYDIKWSPSGNDIAIATVNYQLLSVYPWASGFGTRYTDAVGLTPITTRGTGWSTAGDVVAYGGTTGIQAWPWAAGFGTKYTDPTGAVGGVGITFANDGAAANAPPTITVAPTVTYSVGIDTGPASTWGITFTAHDDEQTGANQLSWKIRTSATYGAGTLVASGTCTNDVSKVVTGLAYDAPGLAAGVNTLYLHIHDGITNTVTASSFNLSVVIPSIGFSTTTLDVAWHGGPAVGIIQPTSGPDIDTSTLDVPNNGSTFVWIQTRPTIPSTAPTEYASVFNGLFIGIGPNSVFVT